MITKSPSQYDGKPVGTPTDAVSAWQAGVTMGPDQIERAEAARKARNRAAKLAHRAAVKAARKAKWESRQRNDAAFWEYKQRRTRAMNMWRSINRKGRTVAWCAKVHGITPEQVFEELKWWEKRHAKRYGKKAPSTRPQASGSATKPDAVARSGGDSTAGPRAHKSSSDSSSEVPA